MKKRHKMSDYLYSLTVCLSHNIRYMKKYIRMNHPSSGIYATFAAHNANLIIKEVNRLTNELGEWMP